MNNAPTQVLRLIPLTVGAVLCTVLAFAPGAHADAVVSLTAEGQLRASVQPRTGADGNHGIIVELYKDLTRNGFRARQDQGGRPAFRPQTATASTTSS
jgi:hypothetical protein